jgi:hypothetical protein
VALTPIQRAAGRVLAALAALLAVAILTGAALAWSVGVDERFRRTCAARNGVVTEYVVTTYYANDPPTRDRSTACLAEDGTILDTE